MKKQMRAADKLSQDRAGRGARSVEPRHAVLLDSAIPPGPLDHCHRLRNSRPGRHYCKPLGWLHLVAWTKFMQVGCFRRSKDRRARHPLADLILVIFNK